jgi:hypothetical protein
LGNSPLRVRGWVSLALIAILTIYAIARSYDQALDINDFEDNYHVAARCAAERCDWLYDRASPVRHHFFVYPPSASIFFYPFSFFSFEGAALLFTLLKVAMLLMLTWGAIAWQRDPPGRLDDRLLLGLLAVLILIQPINSDVYNGQINLIVAGIAIAGVRLAMESRRAAWAGATLVAVAAAIKGAGILLLAVPLLHRRWRILATGVLALVFVSLALPVAWYGPATARTLFTRASEVVDGTLVGNATGRHLITGKDMEIGLSEVILFTIAQVAADGAQFEYDAEERNLYSVDTVGTPPRVREQVPLSPFPLSNAEARTLWVATSVATGLAFLIGRFCLARRRSLHWSWDASMLIVLMLLLTPVLRRAHLVSLIFPVGFVLVSLHGLAGTWGWRRLLADRSPLAAGAGLTLALLVLSDRPGIWIPGSPMPYRISLLLALLGMLCVLTQLALAGAPGLEANDGQDRGDASRQGDAVAE